MSNFIDSVRRTVRRTQPPVQQLTRVQARKLILERINPLLEREGFIHRKGNNLWRIVENKTDVIELRFLTLEEHQKFKLPESTFSINYGCFYHFIPDIYNGRYLHELANLITPLETYCHYRKRARRSIKQKPKGMDISAWHLDETQERQQIVIDDVVTQLETEVFPILNRLTDRSQWLEELESNEFNTGMGEVGSVTRRFLMGFTYKELGKNQQAKDCLINAKELIEKQSKKLAKHLGSISPDAPLFVQARIIDNALTEIYGIGGR